MSETQKCVRCGGNMSFAGASYHSQMYECLTEVIRQRDALADECRRLQMALKMADEYIAAGSKETNRER